MKTLLTIGLVLSVLACHAHEQDGGPPALADRTVEAGTYSVICGCKLESVGHCGNYIEIDDQWAPIGNSEALGLGKMEWCREPEAVQAQAAGAVTDGQFLGTSLSTN